MGKLGTELEELTRTKTETRPPKMYKVLLLNDDFTPMDFVVQVLAQFFQKNENDAIEIMLNVHQKGVGIAGVYSYDIAETKVYLVSRFAKQNQHPLKCTMEPE